MAIDISKFEGLRVLVVGDLMIDEYLWGKVERISPEAPVQVVAVEREEFTLGGAGNVVNNLVALGAEVTAAGVIGTGREGRLLLEKFGELGVGTRGVIPDPERPTTRKTRIIAANQHVLRIDRETRRAIARPILEKLIRFLEDEIPRVDIVLISDYDKGVVTRQLMERMNAAARRYDKTTIADPKGLDFSRYRGVSLLTPNLKEAAQASGIEIDGEGSLTTAGRRVLEQVGIDRLLITCGKDGIVLFEDRQPLYRIGAVARQVFDVSGAGDTVLAVLGLAMASGESFRHSAALANTAAGIVVGKVGTATVDRRELAMALRPYADDSPHKHRSLPELVTVTQTLKRQNKKLVLTNGCFDLLHPGHINLFSASKQLGDVLVVAIDDDDSVRRLKGSGRPVIGARERVRLLNALDAVDYIIVFATEDLPHLIEAIRPDILTKGSNYTSQEVSGHQLVEKLGGRIELIPVTEKISSTAIINNIKKH